MWVVIALVSLAVLIILVLCVPLDLKLHVEVYGQPKFKMRLAWLFGLVSKEVTRKKPKEGKKVGEAEPKPKERKRGFWSVLKIVRTRGLLKQVKRLIKDILGCLKIRDLTADFDVGLDDPADTGILFAAVGPAALAVDSLTACQVRIRPAFGDGPVLEGYSSGTIRLQPIRLGVPVSRFIFSLPAFRMVKNLVMTKWKRRK